MILEIKTVEYLKKHFRQVYICECDNCQTKFELKKSLAIRQEYHFCSTACQKSAQLLGGILDSKKKATFIRAYGVDNPMKSKEVKNSFVNPYAREDVKKKIKDTLLSKYGVDNAMKCEEVKNHLRKSIITKYGSYEAFAKLLTAKRTNAMLEKYGVKYAMHIPDFVLKVKETKAKRGVELFMSKTEKRIGMLLCQLFDVVHTQRWIENRPIDFFIPAVNLYIQVDGVFHHGLIERSLKYEFVRKNVERDVEQNKYFEKSNLKLLRIGSDLCDKILVHELKAMIISFLERSEMVLLYPLQVP